jgi:hypothetical protein
MVGGKLVVVHRTRNSPQAPAARRPFIWVPIGAGAFALSVANASAQEAEPRSYSNTPIGLNFLIAGYSYSEGKIAFDPDLAIANAKFFSNTEAFAYVRSFDLGGQSAKFDVIVPTSSFSAQALVNGLPAERQMAGLNDPRFRLSVNLFGAPALSAKDFASYHQDLIVGISMQVSAPLGQYDDSKLLNLGLNRWSFKPELGISKASGPWTFELAPSVTLFTDNKDQENARAGFTLALPIDRNNSLKLSASTNITTRTGSEFSAIGVAWQYRWGDGY